MCGIAGLIVSDSFIEDNETFEAVSRMTSTLVSRGPDASGVLVDLPIAFGHRRLSIIDPSEAGAQPMRLGAYGPIISYNGEIYNFSDLRDILIGLGHDNWRGHSDTEVILHVYAEWGLDGLKRLEGIFSLALWDPIHNRLVLMRDRLGVKPLFYGDCKYGLAFGSEIKAILSAGGVNKDLDDQSFSEYLWYGHSYGSRTFYKGVSSLKPGHWLIVENGIRTLEEWWRIEDWIDDSPPIISPRDSAILLRDALDVAVNRQLMSDVPLGLFLSGGVDSSAIAASVIQNDFQNFRSFSAGFDFDKGVNELPKASIVADHLNLNHHEFIIDSTDLQPILLKLAHAHDEPFSDSANIPLYLMCEQLQSQAKVVLQGDGGDELFGGYRRYSLLRNANFWRLWPQTLTPLLRSLFSPGKRLARIAETLGNQDPALRMAFLLTVETQHSPPENALQADRQQHLIESTNPFQEYQNAANRFANFEPTQQMMLTDLILQLPSQYLTKVDRASMAASIEARVPLLDEGVLRLALNFPTRLKVSGLEKKIVLRNSQRERLPRVILDGPKTGFGVPYGEWLRSSLFEFACDHILDPSFLSRFSINQPYVEQILFSHRNGPTTNGFLLWKLLQLSLWSSFS